MTLDVLLVRLNPRTQMNLSRTPPINCVKRHYLLECATQIHLRSGLLEELLAREPRGIAKQRERGLERILTQGSWW